MDEHLPSPQFEERIRLALGGARARPEFVCRLEQHLQAWAGRMQGRPAGRSRRLAWRWALAVLLMLILVGVLVVGPANLAAAMQRLWGYMPGVGLVEDSGGLRVLAAPVSLEREGITVTVEQAVIDSERTIILMKVDGIPGEAWPQSEHDPACYQSPELILPGGEAAQLYGGGGDEAGSGCEPTWRIEGGSGGGRGWGSGYSSRMVFAGLPAGVERAVLHVPCLFDTAPGKAPEDWSLELRFVPAPPEATIVPVHEVTPWPPPSAVAGVSALILERVIELEEHYILIGSFHQGADLAGGIVMGISAWPDIIDARGRRMPIDTPLDIERGWWGLGGFPWTFRIPKGFAPPLTISLHAVDVEYFVDIPFELDTGPNPKPDQEWVLNRDFEVAGRTIRLLSVIRREGIRKNGYEFTFSLPDRSITAVGVEQPAPYVGGYGGSIGDGFIAGILYPGRPPSGVLTFRISRVILQQQGPWTLTWMPPEGSVPDV